MKRKACLVISALGLGATPLLANGFYVPVQAPEATARGNAWLATADSAAAVYYNAAGLTAIDSPEVLVGAYAVLLGLEADLDSGANEEGDSEWSFLPQIYAAVPINDKLVAGFGLNTPFGLSTDWDNNSQFNLLAIETELTYATAWAVLGYQVTDTFSIGGGFGIHHADLRMRRAITGAPSEFEYNGDSEALSWTVSAMWKPHEQHSFGAVYRSKADFKLDGDAKFVGVLKEDATLDFITPATVGGGYAFSPCKEWVFEANIEWVNWDEFNTLNLTSEGGTFTAPNRFDWESNFIYSVGATRFFGNGWNVSAGYNFLENSIPDSNYNPGVADADRHWLNAGVGRQYDSFSWNFAYQFAFSDEDVSGSPGGLADGTFKSRFHGLMMNCNWQF